MSEHYCRLYIDTDDERANVQAVIYAFVRGCPEDVVIDVALSRNKAFDPSARAGDRYDPILCSPLTAEIGVLETCAALSDLFEARVIQLVMALRAQGFLVTASCDFEDRVREATGWNWSTDTTEPPGRMRARTKLNT